MTDQKIGRLPRDSAGSFKVPSTKDGAITTMCSLPTHLEIYTPGETFKMQTPEGIDPARTNPNALFLNVKTHDVGSSSPLVARTFIMASDMLKSRMHPRDEAARNSLLMRMHGIKERLLECDAVSAALNTEIAAEIAAIESEGMKLAPGGRAYDKFPMIPLLEGRVTAFLLAARRAITEICQIPAAFWQLSRVHSSLDHLLRQELITQLGEDHRLVTYLRNQSDKVRLIIELRNGQEHASTTGGKKLNVRNFEMLPTNQVRPPHLFLDGDEPGDLAATFRGITEFLLSLAEGMFIGCIDSTLSGWPPMIIREVESLNVECPIRYELVVDGTFLGAAPWAPARS